MKGGKGKGIEGIGGRGQGGVYGDSSPPTKSDRRSDFHGSCAK